VLRRPLRAILLAGALVAVLASALGAYARDAILPRAEFGRRAASTLETPAVQDAIAGEVAGRFAAQTGLPGVFHGPLDAAVGVAVARPGLHAVVRDGAEVLQRRLLADPDRPVRLPLRGAEARVRRALERRVPAAAALPEVGDPVVTVTGAGSLGHALNAADRLGALLPAALVGAVALLGLAALLAPTGAAAVRATGIVLLVAGGVLLAGCVAGRAAAAAAAGADGGDRTIAAAVWDAFLGDLVPWAVGLGVAGVAGLLLAARRRPQYATDAR
jgi:hypothetical protein